MIISRTPFRISFFGGGTDYPAWYRRHGGAVLAASIDKYCYLTCRYLPPFLEHRIRIVYSRIEQCQTVDEIAHPVVREALRFLKVDRGIEIHHAADLPGRSGMGSSSSFTVGLLHALSALKGKISGKRQLARDGIALEQERLQETVGSQDQVCAAYGGLNQIHFLQNGDFTVQPLTLPRSRVRELNAHLMLFYTGIRRTASKVAASYGTATNIERCADVLVRMREYVDRAVDLLNSRQSISAFGELLHENWMLKRELSDKVSNPEVDALYERARSAGAVGGKLLGAGAGGFLLLFVPPDRQAAVRARLENLLNVPFKFEFSGSQIIFFDPEEDYARLEKARASQQLEGFREMEIEPG
ncbi:MAG TPA: kinase [Verrucomicrobia bacterium]|nr:kinase [Verrucomicrobiota bacterium]HOB33284.1 kinase [Verrucomicrobiota bacterium]HOP95961.1 kinase [Verrucomicrobiota bacterium]HPU55742.1 kinase [Verrucomicrobiota bacterium]